MRIGVLGSGEVGAALVQRFREAGHQVAVADGSPPAALAELAGRTGAAVGTVPEVVSVAQVLVLALPFGAVLDLPTDDVVGRVVLDATDHDPARDGPQPRVDDGTTASSVVVAEHLRGARVVKALNTLPAEALRGGARPQGDPQRLGVPVAGDDEDAKALVARLVDQIGFDPVNGGTLADSEGQEPGTPVHGALGTADEVRTLLHGGRGAQTPHAPRTEGSGGPATG